MDKNKIFIGICILFSAILISFVIIYSNNQNNSNRYKVAGARVFDTKLGKYVNQNSIISIPEAKSTPTPSNHKIYTAEDFATPTPEPPKGDISKVVITGSASDNTFNYIVNGTIKNTDTYNHKVYVEVTLYDVNKKPIDILDSDNIYLKPGDSSSFKIETTNSFMTKKYRSYGLKIIERKTSAF